MRIVRVPKRLNRFFNRDVLWKSDLVRHNKSSPRLDWIAVMAMMTMYYRRAFSSSSSTRYLSALAPALLYAYYVVVDAPEEVEDEPLRDNHHVDAHQQRRRTRGDTMQFHPVTPPWRPQRHHSTTLCEETLQQQQQQQASSSSSSPAAATFVPHSSTSSSSYSSSSSSTSEFHRRYTLQSPPLGQGTFGTVYRAVDKTTGRLVAVKRMNNKNATTTLSSSTTSRRKKKKNQDNDDNAQQPSQQSNTNGEVQALLHLDRAGGHPNICSLVGYYPNDSGTTYLVLELVEGCEMFDHLVNQGAYSEYDASRLVREVGSALAYLHGVGVIHMDLKPENIMLNSLNPSNAVVKLIDFGCAVVTTAAAATFAKPTPLLGRTLAYCPPEVLEGSDDAASPSADMYALGTLLYGHGRRLGKKLTCRRFFVTCIWFFFFFFFFFFFILPQRYHFVHYADGHPPVRSDGTGDRCRSSRRHLSTSPSAVA
jgi:tRNA A-37 threonylcarbamoyl transferase component Bud32